jgi:hypothetical protein
MARSSMNLVPASRAPKAFTAGAGLCKTTFRVPQNDVPYGNYPVVPEKSGFQKLRDREPATANNFELWIA